MCFCTRKTLSGIGIQLSSSYCYLQSSEKTHLLKIMCSFHFMRHNCAANNGWAQAMQVRALLRWLYSKKIRPFLLRTKHLFSHKCCKVVQYSQNHRDTFELFILTYFDNNTQILYLKLQLIKLLSIVNISLKVFLSFIKLMVLLA